MPYIVIICIVLIIIFKNRENILSTIIKEKEKVAWSNAFNNNSLKKEIINYINENYLDWIYVYPDRVEYSDGNSVVFSKKDYPNIELNACNIFITQIKNELRFKKLYLIKEIRESINSSSGPRHLIGFTQTLDGNFVADYSDSGSSYRTVGYKLVLDIKERANFNKNNSKIDAWKK